MSTFGGTPQSGPGASETRQVDPRTYPGTEVHERPRGSPVVRLGEPAVLLGGLLGQHLQLLAVERRVHVDHREQRLPSRALAVDGHAHRLQLDEIGERGALRPRPVRLEPGGALARARRERHQGGLADAQVVGHAAQAPTLVEQLLLDVADEGGRVGVEQPGRAATEQVDAGGRPCQVRVDVVGDRGSSRYEHAPLVPRRPRSTHRPAVRCVASARGVGLRSSGTSRVTHPDPRRTRESSDVAGTP